MSLGGCQGRVVGEDGPAGAAVTRTSMLHSRHRGSPAGGRCRGRVLVGGRDGGILPGVQVQGVAEEGGRVGGKVGLRGGPREQQQAVCSGLFC